MSAEHEAGSDPVSVAGIIEACLFACGEPLSVDRLSEITGKKSEEIEGALEELSARYVLPDSGLELVRVAGKYQFRTRVEIAPFLRALRADRPRRLSAAALETLAVIAYRQPIVKSDIETIRGVDATPTLKTLLERGLVRIFGHKPTVGQPALYGTTEEFLKVFGLQSLGELPTLRDLKELEEDPGESELEPEAELEAEGEGEPVGPVANSNGVGESSNATPTEV